MSRPPEVQRIATVVLSVAMVVLGVAILARTITGDVEGLAIGFLLGPLFIAAGLGRLYVASR